MPIFVYRCENCLNQEDHYSPTFQSSPVCWKCQYCGRRMPKIIAPSAPALWFEEGRGRWIENLTDTPQYVTSKAQLKKLEKQYGVVNATTDDLLYNKTRRALDARRESPHDLKDAFRKAVESL